MRIVTFTPTFGAHVDAPRRRAAARQPARAELRRGRGRLCRRAPAGVVRSRRRVAAQGAPDPRPARPEHGARRDAAARVGAARWPTWNWDRRCPDPGKLICVGLNYKDHAAESNMAVPKSPVTFSKYVTSVIGEHKPIRLPAASSQVDYEAELAVVIGRRAKHVPGRQGVGLRAGLHEPERRQRARPAVCRRPVATRQVVRHLRAHRPGHRHPRRRRQPARAPESACG